MDGGWFKIEINKFKSSADFLIILPIHSFTDMNVAKMALRSMLPAALLLVVIFAAGIWHVSPPSPFA